MADTKLSALTALAVTPADADEFYINDGGVSKKIAYSTIKAGFATAAQGSTADSAVQPGDATTVVYVSTDGLDANDGLDPSLPKLTLPSAVTAASALVAGGATYVRIHVIDSGVYDEGSGSIIVPANVHVDAPSATFVGRFRLQARASVNIAYHFAKASGQKMLETFGTEAGGTAYYRALKMDGRGTAGTLTSTINISNSGSFGRVLLTDVQTHFVSQSGTGIGDLSGAAGHIHARVGDIYLAGNNAIGISGTQSGANAGSIIASVDHVVVIGAFTGTTAISVDGADVKATATVGDLNAATAWNIANGAALYLTCPKITGTRTGTPAQLMLGTADFSTPNDTVLARLHATALSF